MISKFKRLTKYYYLSLLVVIIFQAVSTVFGLSRTVYYQRQINHLQQEYQQLSTSSFELDTQLSQELSLAANTLALSDKYTPIQDTLVLTSDQRVALR
ncbi:MAG: hypothetical protein GF381_03330 [Candidatus Pacebacteria bacterium]|nr:hypothetical protein [Candidatus Paceibacterota bacterium]